ncbi:MAG: c-type cytochrome [Sulfuricellaceae bacterium]|nr:c-type cytochrome [Sulfuricellaceae bacterium]
MHRLIIATGFVAFAAWSQASSAATTVAAPHPGRLLASNCFQCHGTNGRAVSGFESLAGESAAEIYKEMKEMQRDPAGENIMHVHARGYTDQELQLIADYFSKQPR